jgi:hypothetical protein
MDKGLKIIGPLTNIYAQTESRNLRVISGTQAKRAGYDRDGGLIDQWLNLPETNPRALKLPSKFTPAEVRVNEQGKVQIRINPAKLGSGGRFAKCVESVTARGGAIDPRAVCAAAGRKKYGAKKFAAMGRAGRARTVRTNPAGFALVPMFGYSGNAGKVHSTHSTLKLAKRALGKTKSLMIVQHDGTLHKGRVFYMDTANRIYKVAG